jgi:hypothetical protein
MTTVYLFRDKLINMIDGEVKRNDRELVKNTGCVSESGDFAKLFFCFGKTVFIC